MISLKRSGSLRTAVLFLLALLLAACSGNVTGPAAGGNQGANAPRPGGPVPGGEVAREEGEDRCAHFADATFCLERGEEDGKPRIR